MRCVCVLCRFFLQLELNEKWMETRGIGRLHIHIFPLPHASSRFHRITMRTSEIDHWTKPENTDCHRTIMPSRLRCFPSATTDFSLQLQFSDLYFSFFFFFFFCYCILFKINSFSNINHCAFGCFVFDRRYSEEIKIHRHVTQVVFFFFVG